MALTNFLEPQVYISYDGTGTFDGADDRVTPSVHHERGIELSMGKDGSQQLSPPRIGDGGFDLKNETGRYTPDNPGSPAYQRLLPVRPVLYTARYGERRLYRSHTGYRAHVPYRGRATYTLGRHVIDDMDSDVEIGNRRMSFQTIGYETVLTRAPITVALMVAPRVDQCITAILDAAGWPADKRSIAIADTQLLYWWCDERNPWDALLELLQAEGPGALYVDGDVLHFENRNYRTTELRSSAVQVTYYDRSNGEEPVYSSLKPVNGFRDIYNRATYATKRRIPVSAASLAKIYEYGAPLTLTANQSLSLFVRPSDPFVEAVSPALGVDYAVVSGAVTVTLSYSSGFMAIISLVAGVGGAVINDVALTGSGIQLRAKSLTVVSEATVENGYDASASIAKFSPIPGQNIPITMQVSGWPEIDPIVATAVCDSWVARQQYPRTQVTFKIQNGNARSLQEILRRTVSDRFKLIHVASGIELDFWLNSARRKISGARGRMVEVTIGAEQCDTLTGGVWDESLWDNIAAVWGI